MLNGILLDDSGSITSPSVHRDFLELLANFNVYAIAVVNDDSEETMVSDLLQEIGAFDDGLLRHRVLFSQSGRDLVQCTDF